MLGVGMLLFSYGSNSPKQLAERLGHPVEGRAAYAEGWMRVFRGYSERWQGAVASLLPSRGQKTYGYVAEVSPHSRLIGSSRQWPVVMIMLLSKQTRLTMATKAAV